MDIFDYNPFRWATWRRTWMERVRLAKTSKQARSNFLRYTFGNNLGKLAYTTFLYSWLVPIWIFFYSLRYTNYIFVITFYMSI